MVCALHIMRARADVVATKLGIILFFLLLFSFIIFFLSLTFLRPNLRAAKGPERSGGTQPSDLFFLVGSGRRSECTMGK